MSWSHAVPMDHPRQRARLLDLHPEFARAIPEPDRTAAARLLISDCHRVPKGQWTPTLQCHDGSHGFALLVVNGIAVREVVFAGRRAAEVVGRGDVVRPSLSGDSSLGDGLEWTASRDVVIAVLDDSFLAASRRWPDLGLMVQERLFSQIERLGLHLAIAQLPRIEDRLLAMLWQLADRFGRV